MFNSLAVLVSILHPAACWIRYIQGKKIQVVPDMFSHHLRFYRFNKETDGEIAIPSVVFAKSNAYPILFNLYDFSINGNIKNSTAWSE